MAASARAASANCATRQTHCWSGSAYRRWRTNGGGHSGTGLTASTSIQVKAEWPAEMRADFSSPVVLTAGPARAKSKSGTCRGQLHPWEHDPRPRKRASVRTRQATEASAHPYPRAAVCAPASPAHRPARSAPASWRWAGYSSKRWYSSRHAATRLARPPDSGTARPAVRLRAGRRAFTARAAVASAVPGATGIRIGKGIGADYKKPPPRRVGATR